MEQTPGGHRIDLQHCRVHGLDSCGHDNQFIGFHCNSVAPRPDIVWQNYHGAHDDIRDTRAKIDDDSRAFESRRSWKRKPDRIFSFDLVQICWIDRRGAYLHDRFAGGRFGPGVHFHAQNIRRISVPFVNDRFYTLVHR